MVGSVSGGCVEGAVVAEALDALADGQPRLLDYGVSDAEAFAVGLACGGRIRVLVEPVGVGQGPARALLEQLVAARAARDAGGLCGAARGLAAPAGRRAAAIRSGRRREAALVADRSGFEGDWFLGVHNPPLRMAVVGAVHIAQALVPMARLAGYDVAVIDPREAFASAARFPGHRGSRTTGRTRRWRPSGSTRRTAVVTLTHDPKLDDPAIAAALRAPVFYLGCLGSSRTHAKRVERLRAAGSREAEIARIHAPIGADIGAKSPAEIAVAILAQITERLRRPGDAALTCASGRFPPPRPRARCWRIRWPRAGLRLKKGRRAERRRRGGAGRGRDRRGHGGAARAGRPAGGRRRRGGGARRWPRTRPRSGCRCRRPSPAGSTSSPRRRASCASTAAAVEALNAVDPAITLATLPDSPGCGRGRWWRRSRSSPTRSAATAVARAARRRRRGRAAGGGVPAGAGEPDPDADAGDEAEPDRQGRGGGRGRGSRRSARRWRRR